MSERCPHGRPAKHSAHLADLHEEFLEGHRLYGRLEGDVFIIEQVGNPPPLLAGREPDEAYE